tara:strand:+ start:736 stop:1242 length:507 start_codon:yes stop_codon:yes gene_type:complete
MPKIVRTDSKGIKQASGKGIVGGLYQLHTRLVVDSDGNELVTTSNAGVVQPAKSVLIGATFLVTTQLASTAGVWGCRIGTAQGGGQLMALDTDSLSASSATVDAGVGTSTHAAIKTSLQGNATLVVVADSGYSATARTIYPEIVCAAGDASAGAAQVWLEFLQYDTDS